MHGPDEGECLMRWRLTSVATIVVSLALVGAHGAGASWIQQSNPTGSQIRTTVFNGVSCTSATFCEAVGPFTDTNDSAEHTLAEIWDGKRWMVQTTPHVPDATAGRFNGVACVSPTACVDVGSATDAGGTRFTLAEIWDGESWAFSATPNPTGATNSELHAVSCASASLCFAVGESTVGGTMQTLAEVWDGE